MYFLDCKLNVFNDACERGCWIVGHCTESGVWNERLVWALGFDFGGSAVAVLDWFGRFQFVK